MSATPAPIPLVDLGAAHREVEDRVREGFADVLARSAFILGSEVAAFEQEYAAFCGVRHCVGVSSGTDALELSLRAAGVGTGDEVIVPANTFIATALAVVRAGALPVFVDCDDRHLLIDPERIEPRITARTRAIVPVHLYGQMADMESVEAIARRHGLVVVEDAAQAQGAERHGRGAGTFGAAAATSFYPGKNIGAYGDAGAVLTNDGEIARRLEALRNWGSRKKYHHPEIGFNCRLDTLQAVVLRAKLPLLEAWNGRRREAARRYDELLARQGSLGRVATLPGNRHVFHLYVVRVGDRDRVLQQLHAAGIGAGVHYPEPLHLTGAFAGLGGRPGDHPEAERAAREVLSLPLFPQITPDQQRRVADVLIRALGRGGASEP